MTVRVGINGFGRIGRNFYRAVRASDIDVVAVNDLTDNTRLAHLLKHDTILGRLDADVTATGDTIDVGSKSIVALAERDPADLPWKDLGVDIVVESTGFFTDAEKARAHVEAGSAKKVIISAPATHEDVTVVMGVNEHEYDPEEGHCHLQRLVYDELPGADGQGAQRRTGHRQGAYDHHPRLHRRPEPAGQHPQGLRRARAAALNVVRTSTGAVAPRPSGGC
jgi:glyceraldehyde 3-phosphate dehydrogenase